MIVDKDTQKKLTELKESGSVKRFGSKGTEKSVAAAQKGAISTYYTQVILALLLVASFIFLPILFTGILFVVFLITLVVTQLYMSNFLEELIEYNTTTTEDRVLLNSKETSIFIGRIDEILQSFDDRIKNIEKSRK